MRSKASHWRNRLSAVIQADLTQLRPTFHAYFVGIMTASGLGVRASLGSRVSGLWFFLFKNLSDSASPKIPPKRVLPSKPCKPYTLQVSPKCRPHVAQAVEQGVSQELRHSLTANLPQTNLDPLLTATGHGNLGNQNDKSMETWNVRDLCREHLLCRRMKEWRGQW